VVHVCVCVCVFTGPGKSKSDELPAMSKSMSYRFTGKSSRRKTSLFLYLVPSLFTISWRRNRLLKALFPLPTSISPTYSHHPTTVHSGESSTYPLAYQHLYIQGTSTPVHSSIAHTITLYFASLRKGKSQELALYLVDLLSSRDMFTFREHSSTL
jgi:hypothetical protein